MISRNARLVVLGAGLTASAIVAAGAFTVVGGFSGPLFGLTQGHSGELLVADASTGVIPVRNGRRGTPIPLPGVTDVSVGGNRATWATTGAGPGGPQVDSGQGVHLITRDGVQKLVDLFEYESVNNPHSDGTPDNPPDSNPFDVQGLGANMALVADAGGNDLLRINRWGNVKLLAVFPTELVSTENIQALAGCPAGPPSFCMLPPQIPAQPVPTSVAVDRAGYIYVGELRGFPAPTNASSIWRVSPNANAAQCGASPDCVKVFDGGFTSIIDLAFGPDGLLYVAELDEGSWAAVEIFHTPAGGTINACSVKWGFCFEVANDIEELTSIAFDKSGALWATRNSLIPDAAEIVKVRPSWLKFWRHFAHHLFK